MRTMINDIKTTITGTFSIDATDMTVIVSCKPTHLQ